MPDKSAVVNAGIFILLSTTCREVGNVTEHPRVLFCNKDCITPLESKGDVKQ